MYILHDGYNEFGRGETKEAAIADAIATCLPQGDDGIPVTREWINEQLSIGEKSDVYGTGLTFFEQDSDAI